MENGHAPDIPYVVRSLMGQVSSRSTMAIAYPAWKRSNKGIGFPLMDMGKLYGKGRILRVI